MSIITPSTPFTPEDLLRLPDAVNYELVGGVLVERNMGLESSEITTRIISLIRPFIVEKKLGHLFAPDASFQCFPDAPNDVRRPDLSFVRVGRFEVERLPKGHCRIAPDFVVEVVSPGDLSYDVEEKVTQYLDAGVRLIWAVYPPTRHVRIHRPTNSPLGPISELTDKDSITGEDILPGFSCYVSKFFQD